MSPEVVNTLPHVNASLNAIATLLLFSGYVLIRQRREVAHRRVMLSCFGVSVCVGVLDCVAVCVGVLVAVASGVSV